MLKSKRKFVLWSVVLSVLIFSSTPLISHAAGLVPCGGAGEHPCGVQDIFYLIARVTNWLILVAGIYAVFQIISNAFWLVVSAGNEENITKHRQGVTSAIIGMFVVLGAYMFVNTAVNQILLSKCKVDLGNPLNYVLSTKPASCLNNPSIQSLPKSQ